MTWNLLTRWFGSQPVQRPDLQVLLYTRQGCCLCDDAWELLQAWQRRYGFALAAKDIDESAELVREFGTCVPVVAINGKVRFRGRINEVMLRRMLEAKSI